MARQYGIAAVSVRSSDVDLAVRILQDSPVKVSSMVGFPHGTATTAAKLYEARDALRRGAREIEAVVNIGKMLSRQFQHVETELLQMAESCHQSGAILKVNLELGYLATDLKVIASKILKRVEADFAVTSTCFGPSGYQASDVALLRTHLKDRVAIKAAGGVRTVEKALEVYAGGCARFGSTATVMLLEDWKARLAKEAAAKSAAGVGAPSTPA
jgi:deoxyribose-phosphate aldolase